MDRHRTTIRQGDWSVAIPGRHAKCHSVKPTHSAAQRQETAACVARFTREPPVPARGWNGRHVCPVWWGYRWSQAPHDNGWSVCEAPQTPRHRENVQRAWANCQPHIPFRWEAKRLDDRLLWGCSEAEGCLLCGSKQVNRVGAALRPMPWGWCGANRPAALRQHNKAAKRPSATTTAPKARCRVAAKGPAPLWQPSGGLH